ncbi:MAG: DUF350 domain-containing protein [Candidatus Undinarchaeales archaeon]|jgi:uncharacterized membrane protein YjfL (UPF0719 family)|nr:DUF350 domain-containing protein [Methanopyri archaeon]MDP7078354.1 DUF350 domain-containing protein [Candidatus Undinarchaeales archaeon]MDP7492097.1 DUF350 domain-containing protein [Candidatus Undinarchaeales archaeon]|tara:strand:- start:1328 stop:1552 length:225 start_codon:yes stop_codon:yes gene_type:complete
MASPALEDIAMTLIYSVVAVLIMAFALPMAFKIFDWITPIDEWEEIKNKNMAVAMYVSAAFISFALVIVGVLIS